MKRLTWKQLKDVVEKKAREQGIADLDNRPIGYVDLLGYTTESDVNLHETDDYVPDDQGRKSVIITS